MDNRLSETCGLNQIALILEYTSLTCCRHGDLMTNGIAVKRNREVITLVDALVILIMEFYFVFLTKRGTLLCALSNKASHW